MTKNKDIDSPIESNDIRKKIEQFESGLLYLESTQNILIARYNDEWIAIYNHEVIAHDKDHDALIRKLTNLRLSDNQLVIKYFSGDDVILLLNCY